MKALRRLVNGRMATAVAMVCLLATAGGVASASDDGGSDHHGGGPSPAPGTSCATATAAPTGPAVVSAARTAYGRVLVVGSGQNSDCSLYYLTSDRPQANAYACTNTGAAGSQCDVNTWPALLSAGSPEAGPGVNPTLLGTVERTDVLSGQTVEQVTYAGHPLYQYSKDTSPGQTNGANLFDTFTAPSGIWYLISPERGLAAPGSATLSPLAASVTTSSGSTSETILSVTMAGDSPVAGPRQFPVYTFSADTDHESSCTETNVVGGTPCTVAWPPVLTTGRPQATGGLDRHGLGIIVRADGTHQVTWDGHPLYLFVRDVARTTAPGTALGQGAGAAFGGTGFYVVRPEEVSPPGVTGAWGDHVSFTGVTTTPLGIVNGYKETRINTTSPSLSSFFKFPGVETMEGTENITIYEACTPRGSECTTASPGTNELAGLDECNPCTMYNSSGGVIGTGSIDMPWWTASGQVESHQQVALLMHGTGALADVHGVLTHPGTTDPRCAPGAGTEGFVGCYAGTVHAEKCISGNWYGPLRVPPGQSVCLSAGARIFGPTNVGKAGELFAEGATFYGPVRSAQAEGFALCSSSVLGSLSVTETTGPVLIGEPATGECGGNFIQGALNVEHNGCATCDANGMDTGSVDISGDTVLGPLRSTENIGAYVFGYFASNSVYGPTVNEGNK